jgi:membrane-associated phospholipid phosphatase
MKRHLPIRWEFLILAAIFAFISFTTLDLPLTVYLHQSPFPSLMDVSKLISYLGNGILVLAFCLLMIFYAAWIKEDSALTKTWLTIFTFVLITGIICDAFKISLGRARPQLYFSDQLFGLQWLKLKSEYWSLPSGHATTITIFALTLSYYYPKLRYAAYACIPLVAISRLILTRHYMSDVIMGFIFACVMFEILMTLKKRLQFS